MPQGQVAKEKQCKYCVNSALVGLTVCKSHGGNLPVLQRKSRVEKLNRFLQPISKNDPEADVIVAFDTEHRRTLARIRYYDEVIDAILSAEPSADAPDSETDPASALFFGVTKIETITATEFPGNNTTREAKMHIAHEAQYREREHLFKLHQLFIGAGIAKKALEIEAEKVRALDSVITGVLRALGHDVRDPEVRRAVRENLMALPGASTVADVESARNGEDVQESAYVPAPTKRRARPKVPKVIDAEPVSTTDSTTDPDVVDSARPSESYDPEDF